MHIDKHFISRALPEAVILSDTFPSSVTFSIDTRTIVPGDIFVALKGTQCDGHDFITEAFEKGAVGAIIAASQKNNVQNIKDSTKKIIIVVQNPLDAFLKLATLWRSQFTCPIIAITGSVGKTSTKEFLSHIIATQGKKYFVSHENQNTKLGLALNILRMKSDHELAIFELGISRRGEMADLVTMLRPTIGLITNIGHQHMDGLGSLNDIAIEKRDIFKYFTEKSIGIINGDQTVLANVSYQHPVIKFGSKTTNQIQVRKLKVFSSHISFLLKIYKEKYSIIVNRPHVGAVFNVLAATSVAHWLGIPDKDIIAAVQAPCVVPGRFEECMMTDGQGMLINDCYNANPESMKAALLAFQQIETTSPKIAILGDMLGLGVNSPFWHRQVGRFLRKVPSLHKVILVGNLVSWVKKTSPVHIPVDIVPSWQDAIKKLEPDLILKPAVLVKGSRAIGLDNLVEKLTK